MVLQLNVQAKQQAALQKRLRDATKQLIKTKKALAQKERLIDSLEVDLEHVISQFSKMQSCNAINRSKQWISRPVPGLNVAHNEQVA